MGALASAKAQRAASRAGRLAAGAGLLLAACLLGSIRHKQAVWPVSSARIGAQAPEIGFDVAVPSSLAGKTQKHGKLGILTQLNRAHKQHGEAVPLFPPEWVAQRVGGDRHAPPPLRVAHIMISDKYKLVYVKCTKTAGEASGAGGWVRWPAAHMLPRGVTAAAYVRPPAAALAALLRQCAGLGIKKSARCWLRLPCRLLHGARVHREPVRLPGGRALRLPELCQLHRWGRGA